MGSYVKWRGLEVCVEKVNFGGFFLGREDFWFVKSNMLVVDFLLKGCGEKQWP